MLSHKFAICHVFILTLFLIGFQRPVTAQSLDFISISTETLFAEQVYVVDMRVDIAPVEPQSWQQIVIISEARIIRVYDEDRRAWAEYNFPEDAAAVVEVQRYGEEHLLVASAYNNTGYSIPHFDYLLNIITGEYSQPPRHCGIIIPHDGQQVYAFFDDEQTGRTAICDVNANHLLTSLPEGMTGHSVYGSPDNRYLLIFAYNSENPTVEVYTYEIANSRLHYQVRVGQLWDISVGFVSWYGEHHVAIMAGDNVDSTPWIGTYYQIDATRAESAEAVYNRILYDEFPILDTDLIWSYRGVGHSREIDLYPCELTRFDEQTGFHTHSIGYDCTGSQRLGNDYYVVRLQDADDTPRLSWLNGETGDIHDILVDENLRATVSASPDYVATLMASNTGSLHIAIINAKTGARVYRTGTAYQRYGLITARSIVWDRLQGGFLSPVRWLEEDIALIELPYQHWASAFDAEIYYSSAIPPSLRIVRLGEVASQQIIFFGQDVTTLSVSPDYRYIVAVSGGVVLADMEQERYRPLLKPDLSEEILWQIAYVWQDSTTLDVVYTANDTDGCPPEHACTVIYTVMLQTGE